MVSSERSDIPKLLIIGRGSIGRKHETNAQGLGVPIVTVDPNPEQEADFVSVEQALAFYDKGYFSHALVASPVDQHYVTLLQLLEEGIPAILVEKPIGLPEQPGNRYLLDLTGDLIQLSNS